MVQYTHDDEYSKKWDQLILTYVILRCTGLFIVAVLCSAQFYFEVRNLIQGKYKITSRTITYFCLIMFPLLRVMDQLSYLINGELGVGTWAWIFGIWSTFFLFAEWIFIAGFWARLLYTFFISDKIILQNIKRTWISAWVFTGIYFSWVFFITGYGCAFPSKSSSLYSYGLIICIIIFGGLVIGNGIVLALYMREQDKTSKRFSETVSKTLRLSCVLLVIVILTILRDIIWAALSLPRYSVYRHIPNAIMAVCEITQCIVVMYALGTPLSYIKFQVAFHSMSMSGSMNTVGMSNMSSKKSGQSGKSSGNESKEQISIQINSGDFNSGFEDETTKEEVVDVVNDNQQKSDPNLETSTTSNTQDITQSRENLVTVPIDDDQN